MPDTSARFALRHLPLPARLVISGFLVSVGVGYFSALVQLHMQHGSRDGQPLPSPADVVEVFAGLKRHDGTPPVSKLTAILAAPRDAGFDKTNMARAFFDKSGGGYEKDAAERGKGVVDAEREGERAAVLAWLDLPAGERKAAFDADKLPVAGGPVTEEFAADGGKTVLVKSVIEARCVKCHGGEQKPDLSDWGKLDELATPPPLALIDGKYVRSSRQLSKEGLTQSTHAHLLSFAMLFSLTGLVFAFTHYPLAVRCVVAPLVLAAQLADIACWWLARVDGVGPLFAQAIIGTGTVVGLGLLTHIVGGLWSLYGRAGRGVLLAFALVAGGGFAVLYSAVLHPELQEEKEEKKADKARKLAPAAMAPAAER